MAKSFSVGCNERHVRCTTLRGERQRMEGTPLTTLHVDSAYIEAGSWPYLCTLFRRRKTYNLSWRRQEEPHGSGRRILPFVSACFYVLRILSEFFPRDCYNIIQIMKWFIYVSITERSTFEVRRKTVTFVADYWHKHQRLSSLRDRRQRCDICLLYTSDAADE